MSNVLNCKFKQACDTITNNKTKHISLGLQKKKEFIMEKLRMMTKNFTDENVAKIAELFPNCVTEAVKGEEKSIDFDLLKQELSKNIVDGPQERYRLDWPGKREALVTANTPITKTLRPCPEESVDFDETENLFIEGDNLEALKLLQNTYLGKVKMIYIDPPYNTGKDFVYSDNFTADKAEFLQDSGQVDEEGGKLVANLESNGRFHSDWLSMMYPRLKLARNLLRDDGVIFISIDDNEQANLKRMCDEVFGESNFIAEICHKARASISNDKVISPNHNFIMMYAKSFFEVFVQRKSIGLDPSLKGFSNPDNDKRGPWKPTPVDGPGGAKKGNPYYEFLGVTGYFRYSKKTMEQKHKEDLIIKTANGIQQKYFLSQAKVSRKTDNTWWDDGGLTSTATRKLQNLMGEKTFDTPKPFELVHRMLKLITFKQKEDAIILDFFAGSSTTAHAVMQLNAEDGGNRKFIMVQIPEECNEKSEAFKAGYKTIAEISKERIRRAGKKIKEELELKNANGQMELDMGDDAVIKDSSELDIGFRVLKVDSSNMADVYYSPEKLKQAELMTFQENIKADRTAEDLLFQVLLDWGVDLTLPITREIIKTDSKEFELFFVDGNSLAACFAKRGEVDEELCRILAQRQPQRIVFRDSGFADDDVKINVEQIFKQLSPHTDVKTI